MTVGLNEHLRSGLAAKIILRWLPKCTGKARITTQTTNAGEVAALWAGKLIAGTQMMMLSATASARNPYIVAKLLAAQGLAVFPVRNKQPLTKRGVYSATSNLDLLARMDGWGNADGCGLATGEVSGVDVLD